MCELSPAVLVVLVLVQPMGFGSVDVRKLPKADVFIHHLFFIIIYNRYLHPVYRMVMLVNKNEYPLAFLNVVRSSVKGQRREHEGALHMFSHHR